MNDSKERKHEIKKVLLNNLVLTDDKRLAVGPDFRITLWGVGDGAGATMVLGVKKKAYLMESEYTSNTQTIYKATEAMKDIGRLLKLEEAPDSASALVRHVFFRPVVLVLEEVPVNEEEIEASHNELVLSAYCGRAPLAGLSIKHALSKLEKTSGGKIKRYYAPKEE
ncbi:hypothetical protein SAMN02910298_02579 [Pseudobutyrivibrio sp. YE44]|uniref:hypothetical protein n=1 Tax=Pseudobutyrivibrio sp. YE44 TaxID=1520802 RepID=UPI0008822E71|nr:hypothetical protein [Pseudobutyrivibrio sp. YE44]SDB50708.1 hypothetical protein SAMN02910298_02579 [Pseudobutyrivibrio sp. YE44]